MVHLVITATDTDGRKISIELGKANGGYGCVAIRERTQAGCCSCISTRSPLSGLLEEFESDSLSVIVGSRI